MSDIFISYRREDSRADAGRLYDHLGAHFGDRHVFMDLDDIAPGEDFPSVLEETLARCRVLIALIGTRWATAVDREGRSRLSSSDDYVRREIETALNRDIQVIPVLVGGADLPPPDALPPTLAPLTRRQAFRIDDARYRDDVARLTAQLDAVVHAPRSPRSGLRATPAALTAPEVKAMLVNRDFYDSDWNASGAGAGSGLESRAVGLDLVVFDPTTSLLWQKGGSDRPMPYQRAVERIGELNDQEFAGRHDWRVPTLEEGMSLMAAEVHDGYHLRRDFEARAAPIMWSCDRAGPDRRWVVYFHNGFAKPESAQFSAHLRAVCDEV